MPNSQGFIAVCKLTHVFSHDSDDDDTLMKVQEKIRDASCHLVWLVCVPLKYHKLRGKLKHFEEKGHLDDQHESTGP